MKKSINIFRNAWIITLVVGVIMGIVGIIKIVNASSMSVPPMSSSDWFDASVAKDGALITGIMLTVIGLLFIALMGSLILFFISRQTPEDLAKKQAKMIENEKRYNEELNKLGIELTTNKKCEYCGSNLNGKNKCDNCGAKNNKNS